MMRKKPVGEGEESVAYRVWSQCYSDLVATSVEEACPRAKDDCRPEEQSSLLHDEDDQTKETSSAARKGVYRQSLSVCFAFQVVTPLVSASS